MTVRVLVATVAHDVADARLHRIAAALAELGCEVEVVGVGDPAGGPPEAGVRSFRMRADGPSRVRDGLSLLRGEHADVIVALDPDLTMMLLAGRRLHGAAVVADVHEDYVAVVQDRAWARPWLRPIVARGAAVAQRVAARADLTLVADDHVPPLSARRRMVVRNLPRRDWLPGPAPRDPEPRAVHVGDLRASRGLFDMVDAIVASPGWTLDLVGRCSDADRDEALSRAGDQHDRIRWHGRLPPREAWQIARGAWVGLSLLHDTPAYRHALPTKVYEFLGAGLPVMTTPLPRSARFLDEIGAGVRVLGPDDAARRLRAWADDSSELDRLAAAAVSWADENLSATSPFAAAAAAIRSLPTSSRRPPEAT